MNLNEYQVKALSSAVYPDKGKNLIYPMLGLAGETGEVSEKIKKMYRDNQGILSEEIRQGLKEELGDVLWYVSALSMELGFTLDEVAVRNIEKLQDRLERNKVHGSGDNR